MTGNISDWLEQVLPLEIPVMQSTLQDISALQSNPNVPAAQIASVVLADPMMTLKLMRLANANKRGEFAQRITIAEHAVMMLGLNSTFALLGDTPALEQVMPPEVSAGMMRCVTRAYHAATHAREWAVQRLDTSPEEVYVATLLQRMGDMAFWVAAPEQMLQLEKASLRRLRDEVELELFGFPLIALSAAMAERLNMPSLLTSAMDSTTVEAHMRPRCVMLADRLSRHVEWGWHGDVVAADLDEIGTARRLPLDDVVAQIHRTAARAARYRVFAEAPPAASWLPMLPGEWPVEEEIASQEKQLQAEPEPVKDPFETAMDEIAHHLDGTYTLSDLLVQVVRGMRGGIGLSRVVFALLTSDRHTLAAKYVAGAEEGSPLKAFRFDMTSRHLMSVLMTKPQSAWMNEANRIKYATLISEDIARTTSGHEFFAMSLKVHDKVIGMFYGDCSGKPLDLSGYERFKQLCGRAAVGMEHLAKAKS